MNIQKIIISTLITVFGLFFILSLTYFNTPSGTSGFSIPEVSEGYNEIIYSGSDISLQASSENDLQEGKFFVDQVNYIDTAFFYGKNYRKEISDRNVTFHIGAGLYLFDLYDVSYNYSIRSSDFWIEPKSPGKFFVDARNTADIKIFSFDSIINIQLFAANSAENMTSLVMYPHMFFGFNAARNKFLKNADVLRIESVSKIFYVNESFLSEQKDLNQKFFEKLYPSNDKDALSFFKNFFYLSYSSTEFDKYNIQHITSILYKDKSLLGVGYIEKYFVFFFNKEKKAAYYKKNILSNLNTLFSQKISDSSFAKVKETIMSDSKNLKEVSNTDYVEFQKIIAFYYKNLLKVNSIDYINSTILLSNIIASGGEKNTFESQASSFYLNRIYALVDNKTYGGNYLQQNLLIFLQHFLQENNLQLKDGELLVEENQQMIQSLDYLSYFLKNILLYNISFSDAGNLDNLFSIINIYLGINKNIIVYYKNPGRTETLIVEYQMILNKFLDEIRKSFFEEELNARGLLILNSNNPLIGTQVAQLNTVINTILDFYNKNKSVLSEKNMNYNILYGRNKVTYNEYYAALSNHPEYLIKYDKAKNDLLNAQTIFEKSQAISLSEDSLVEYLSQFQGVDISSMSYKIISDEYYELQNIYINGESFSFFLYPNEFYRIDEIVKNGQKLSGSYELESLKQDLALKYEQVPEEEKYKYEFTRFFVNTFFNTQETTSKIYEENQEVERTEDRTITFFKRDKLFGEKGDFSVLSGYLDVKYDDVDVELNANNQYNISIKKGVLRTKLDVNGSLRDIVGVLKSEYVFSDTDHFFRNMYITFYDAQSYGKPESSPLFSGKEFRIVRRIDILKFKTEMNKEITRIFTNN